jgi:hypothetical protein
MQLLSALSKLIAGQPQQNIRPQEDDQAATRPMEEPRRQDDRTRPSRRIRDEQWLKIQKVIDQAG